MLNFLNLRIMKAKNLLKILFSLVAFFMVSSAFSQTYPGNLIESTPGTSVDSVTGGVAVPYYVAPDPVLNPAYSTPYPANAGDLDADEIWVWSIAGIGGDGTTANQGADGAGGNQGPYIEVTWNAPGGAPVADSLYVQEQNSGITCDGTSSGLEVLVFDPPSFQPVDGSNELIEVCGTQDVDIPIAQVADNYVDGGNLKIMFDISCENVDPADVVGDAGTNVPARTSPDTVVVMPTIVDADGTADGPTNLLPAYDITIQGNDVTRYRFSFGAADDGISDMISRKSDYLTVGGTVPGDDQSWSYYAATDGGNGTNIDVVVYPQPNTGNIYYVPSDFDQ